MSRRFPDDGARAALLDAVRAIEATSAAEVVVVVRERAGYYLHADLIAGIAAGYAVLWFQIFSPWDFSLVAIQVAPAVVGGLMALATSTLPGVRRILTPRGLRDRFVRTAALAAFQERGVGLTRGRTGVLVFIALLERSVEVVADQGVGKATSEPAWPEGVQRLRSAVRSRDGIASAAALRDLGRVLESALPRSADDVNELADEIGVA